ncbi:MAG: carbohydrate-binding protein [Terracidiphilus sp.]
MKNNFLQGPIMRIAFYLFVSLTSSASLMAQGTDILDISAGATAASGSYTADKDYSGGAAAYTSTTISTTGVTNPAPEAVYQNQRYGNFTYTLPGFTSGTTYLVRLHFDEFYWTAAGKREFNVLINGTQVLTDFDVFATSGGEFKAVVEQFNAVANSSGDIVIQFVSVVDNAEVNGIEIETASAAEGPYPGPSAAVIPGTVLAENYDTGGQGVAYNVTSTNGSDNAYRPQGVDLEAASSPATGNDLGWTAAGQWFKYTVNVSTAGTYTVSFLVASESAVTDAFHLSNSSGTNLSGSVAVPDTGGWQTWETVTATVTLPAGTQTLTLNQDAAGWNIDSFVFASSGGGTTEAPYPGPSAAAIPGTVLAENYDTGGQGVAYNVTSTNGSDNAYRPQGVDLETASSPATGNDLGWTASGQWFRYTVNVSTAGTYTVSFLVASPDAITDAFHLSNSSGTDLSGDVAVPATGGYQDWVTVTASVTLPAGTQTLTLNQDAAGWNIDSLAFASTSGGGGYVPIANGGFTLTPQNAPTFVLDDSGASTATGNPIDIYTPNSSTAQAWAVSNSGVTPAGYYNLAVIGAYCLTASGTTSGSIAVLDPCAGTTGQAWEAVEAGSAYTFHPDNNLALCLTANGTTSGSAVVVDTCSGGSNQEWGLTVVTNGGGPGPGGSNCTGVANITVGGTTYTPSWCQEFNGAAGPAPTAGWGYDLGNNGGWGNGELEVYCGPPGYPSNPSQCPTTFSTSTAPVYLDGNGHLVIQPLDVGGTWISARLNTDGGQLFQYGIIEASIELPNMTPEGLWPAFWGLGNNINSGVSWPTCGETDILEDWSPSVDGGAGNAGENSTIHTMDTGGDGVSDRFLFPSGEAANTGFHTYGMIWSANEIQYFVDDPATPFATLTPGSLPSGDTWPFNQPIFLILNEAIGGTLGGSAPASTPGPMTIDYVRWYAAP